MKSVPQKIVDAKNPIMPVQNNALVVADNLPDDLKKAVEKASRAINAAIPAVGQLWLHVEGQAMARVGTGWLIQQGQSAPLVMTNQHVLAQFSNDDEEFLGTVTIDFSDTGADDPNPVTVTGVVSAKLYPDMAVLELASAPSVTPISLAASNSQVNDIVVVIGYPTGPGLDCKCVSPGNISQSQATGYPAIMAHTCSTQPGNSGSVVLALGSGNAAGLHYGAEYNGNSDPTDNYAVVASALDS